MIKGAPVRGYEDLLAAAMQAQPVFEALLRAIVSSHPAFGNPNPNPNPNPNLYPLSLIPYPFTLYPNPLP